MLKRLLVVSLAVVLGGVPLLIAVPASAAPTLPDGFSLVSYDTGQSEYGLTNFAWLPDRSLLTIGKSGTITFVPPVGSPRWLARVPDVRAVDDHGLLGLALAPDYATTGHVYLGYDKGPTAGEGHGMLEEWQAAPAASPTTFTRVRTVVDGSAIAPALTEVGTVHGPDSVIVAADGSLFWSIGDNAGNNGDPLALRAQDLDDPHGKILHLTADGRGVSTNPFFDAAHPGSWRSMVYVSGLRNPFRISIDPRSGLLHVGDVGWNRTEEVSMLKAGDNAGWPCFEGSQRTTFGTYPICQQLYAAGSPVAPVWTYPHAGSGASVVGGVLYTGTSYPPQYRGSYFLGDYTRRKVWTMAVDAVGVMTRAPETDGFISDAGGPSAFQPGPNGDITFADIVSGKVERIIYSKGDRKPTAVATFTTDADHRTVLFSADGSYDPDGDTLSYRWNFGDGTTGSGVTPAHTYRDAQPRKVTLSAEDPLGVSDSTTITVYPANHSPVLKVTPPRAGKLFAVGEPVELSATATDAEDGTVPVTYDTALKHCPFVGSCHVHPDGQTTGAAYSKPFTDHGADTSMQITVTATDAQGATTSQVYLAEPNLRTIRVTSPVPVNVDGVTTTSSQEVEGAQVQLDAPESAGYLHFVAWSDAGAAQHTFTMPNRDVALTASYQTFIKEKYKALGGTHAFLGKATSPEHDTGNGRTRSYEHGRILWSAATGAHEVHGAILKKFRSGGGIETYGFPTSDQTKVKGGHASTFTSARIYTSKAGGTRAVLNPILSRYLAAGGPDGYGLPRNSQKNVKGGTYQGFSGSRSIYSSTSGGAHTIFGAVRREYKKSGYERGCLGLPTSEQHDVSSGQRTDFQGGYILLDATTEKTSTHC